VGKYQSTVYEWVVVTIFEPDSEHPGEIEEGDHCHAENFADAVRFSATPPSEGGRHEIVLVRDVETDGSVDRSWAYMHNGTLSVFFVDSRNNPTGVKVPKRFFAEIAASAVKGVS